MKNIILHIGTGKTGTSSIQNALYMARSELCRSYSMDYANVGLSHIDHFGEKISAHYALVDMIKSKSDNSLDALVAYVEKSKCNTIVFSCENLYHNLSFSEVKKFSAALSKFSVRVICYVRRQDLYVESAYKQQVKVGDFKMTFSDFIKRHVNPDLLNVVHANYYAMLKKWALYFGRESITVRPFDVRFFENRLLLDDFSNSIGLPSNFLSSKYSVSSNPTLQSELIEVVREFNASGIVPRDRQQDLVAYLQKSYDFKDFSMLDGVSRVAIINNYKDQNQLLRQEYGLPEEWDVLGQADVLRQVPPEKSKNIPLLIIYSFFCKNTSPYTLRRFQIRAYLLAKDFMWILSSAKRSKAQDPEGIFLSGWCRIKMVVKGDFSPTYYLSRYQDVDEANIDPFLHYSNYGKAENRVPHPRVSSHFD